MPVQKETVLPDLSVEAIIDIIDAGWTKDAACTGVDSLYFFPPENSKGNAIEFYARGRKVCAVCPVSAECLRFSILTADNNGMWGGTTPRERSNLDNYQRWQDCQKCGRGFYYKISTSRRYICGECQENSGRTIGGRHYE